MQLTPVAFQAAPSTAVASPMSDLDSSELDSSDLTAELAGARQSLNDALDRLDQLGGVVDAKEGARLAVEVGSLLSWSASQLDDAVTFADGFDEDVVDDVARAQTLATQAADAWSGVDVQVPAAIKAAIDGTYDLADAASAHAGSALDHFGV